MNKADFTVTKQIQRLANDLLDRGARSVFVYGSRARGDNKIDSDWEIGVIFDEVNYIPRQELAILQTKGVVIYPFKYEELSNGIAHVPFTKSIWLTEIITTSKTISGEEIVSSISRPEITTYDIIADNSFYKARSIDSMVAKREGFDSLAHDLFIKSALLGSRVLIIHHGLKFPESYGEIVELARPMLETESQRVISRALELRTNSSSLTINEAFDCIGLQMEIEQKIRSAFR